MPDLYDSLRKRGCIDPVLVHASVACQVGEECPFPTFREMAEHYGVGTEQLRQYIRGDRELQPRLAKAFGLEKIVLYAPAQGMSAGTAETPEVAQGKARQPGPQDAPRSKET